MSADKRYVLCMQYPNGGILYVCGPDPATSRACRGVHEAVAFGSFEEALAFRDRLPHQEGDYATQYTVHSWTPEGRLVPRNEP